jgi:hypothetical protein
MKLDDAIFLGVSNIQHGHIPCCHPEFIRV